MQAFESLQGPSVWTDLQGQVLSEQSFWEGKPHGIGRMYYASGALYRVVQFEQGVKVGEQISYYPDGSLKTLEYFVDGKLEGECRLYWPSGRLKRQVHFCHGVRQGVERYWSETSTLLAEHFFEEGKLRDDA